MRDDVTAMVLRIREEALHAVVGDDAWAATAGAPATAAGATATAGRR